MRCVRLLSNAELVRRDKLHPGIGMMLDAVPEEERLCIEGWIIANIDEYDVVYIDYLSVGFRIALVADGIVILE